MKKQDESVIIQYYDLSYVPQNYEPYRYVDLDVLNINEIVDWYELGYQEWINGRLVVFSSYKWDSYSLNRDFYKLFGS